MTLIKISSCFWHCVWVFVGLSLEANHGSTSRCHSARLSLFPSLTAPKSGKTKQNTMLLCVLLSVITYVCLENFFFSCLTVANSGPILLFCSLIQVTWSQWKQKHRPKDFRGSVWMLFTSVNSVWKLVSVEELKVTLAQVASEQLCLHVSFFFALGLMGLGSVSLSLILYCLVLITTRQSSVSQITCCLTVYLSSKAILECDG